MATYDALNSLTHPLPDQVAACLRTEADVLEAAIAEGDLLDTEAAVPMITLALEGAGLATDQARACALLLAETILPPVGPLDEVWKGLRNSITASGKTELGSGEVKYLVARVVKGLGVEREAARRMVCTLATAAGLRVRESATAPGSAGSADELPASSSLVLEDRSTASATAGAGIPPGAKLRQALRDAAPGAEIRLPGGEFEGSFEFARAVKLIGQGDATTLWARQGPVVVVKAGGVTLGDLLIEVTAEPDGVALRNEAPQEPRLDRVTLKGRTEGLAAGPSPSGIWNLPVAIDFGTLPPKTIAERVVDLETPGPGTARTPLAGVRLEPAGLPGGSCRLRVILDGGHLHSGTMLMGDVEITCGVERRSIPLSATVQSSVTPTAPSTSVASSSPAGTVGGVTTTGRGRRIGKPSNLVLVGGLCSLAVALAIVLLNYARQDRPLRETSDVRAQRQQADRPMTEPRASADGQGPQTQTNARREEQKEEGVAIQEERVERSGVGPQRRTEEARRQDQTEARQKAEEKGNLQGEGQKASPPTGAEIGSAKIYYDRAAQRYKQGDLAGARADLQQVIALEPKNSKAYNDRGFLRKKLGDLAGARADYDQAIALNPQYARAYNNRAILRMDEGDLAGARTDLDQAIALEPKNSKAYNDRGFLRKKLRDLAGARADYDQAIALGPQNAAAYNDRALLRMDLGDLGGAGADFDQAIALDSKAAILYGNRGMLRNKLADLAGARADFDQAIVLNPKYARSYYERGLVRQKQGDLEGAVADFDEAVTLDPNLAAKGHPGKQIAMSVAEEVRDFARKNGLDPMKVGDYSRAIQLLESSTQYTAATRLLTSAKEEIQKQLKTGW